MADKPKKKVTIVAKKKAPKTSPAAEPQPDGPPPKATSARSSGARKKDDKGLLDLQRWLDFPAGVAENARDVWMAGIGALSSVEEAGQAIFEELVKKGERWERESRDKLLGARKQAETAAGAARSAAHDLGRQPARLAAEAEQQIQRLVEESVEGVLHRIGVPTHEEVRELIRRVETLSGKVDALMVQLDRPDTATGILPPVSESSEFRVAPGAAGWVVEEEGASRARSEHPTKASAVAAGREIARREAPSTLVVLRQDGTEQGRYSYEAV
jgi:poly(hydroxyalkanoate) granule-associated protein